MIKIILICILSSILYYAFYTDYNTIKGPSSEGSFSIKDTVKDTIYIPTFDYEMKYDLLSQIKTLDDSIHVLRRELSVYKNKIEVIRYYLKIVKHNRSQLKFFVGWINRQVN